MYSIFRNLAIIILSAKFFGLVARKCKAPQVVGEILAGLVIGPCVLNLVQTSDSIATFAEIGVVLLMFTTGLGTNLKELIKAGPIATLIACRGCGSCPLVGGTLLYSVFYGFCRRGQPGVLSGTVHRYHHDCHQRVHHGGHPAGAGPPEELSWALPSSVLLSLMMSSASWCLPVCWVPAAAPVRVWARCW